MPAASPAGSRHPCFAPTPGARCRPAARRRRAVSEFDAIAWGNYLMDKAALRRALIEESLNLPDRLQRADLLQQVMRIWLVNRPDTVIGAYWPIKGEFDPPPARRRIGLPVVDKQHKTLSFHAWHPGCPMEEDAYGIPKPKGTGAVVPT